MGGWKHGIMLDAPQGPLRAVVPQLEAMDFQAIVVPEAEAALALARGYSKLALVAVNGASLQRPERLARARAGLDVPLIWVGPGWPAPRRAFSNASLLAFDAKAKLQKPFLRANRAFLAELNAVLAFAGEGLAGHVLVSASVEVARAVAAPTAALRAVGRGSEASGREAQIRFWTASRRVQAHLTRAHCAGLDGLRAGSRSGSAS